MMNAKLDYDAAKPIWVMSTKYKFDCIISFIAHYLCNLQCRYVAFDTLLMLCKQTIKIGKIYLIL